MSRTYSKNPIFKNPIQSIPTSAGQFILDASTYSWISISLKWFFFVRDWHRNRVPLTCEMPQTPFWGWWIFACEFQMLCSSIVWIQDWWQISCWKPMNSLNDPNASIAMKTWVWFLDIFVFFVFESGWNWQNQSSERWTHTNSNRLSGCFFLPSKLAFWGCSWSFFHPRCSSATLGWTCHFAWSKFVAFGSWGYRNQVNSKPLLRMAICIGWDLCFCVCFSSAGDLDVLGDFGEVLKKPLRRGSVACRRWHQWIQSNLNTLHLRYWVSKHWSFWTVQDPFSRMKAEQVGPLTNHTGYSGSLKHRHFVKPPRWSRFSCRFRLMNNFLILETNIFAPENGWVFNTILYLVGRSMFRCDGCSFQGV